METSDSECFESADEEVYTENDGGKSKKLTESPPTKANELEHIADLNIDETANSTVTVDGNAQESKPMELKSGNIAETIGKLDNSTIIDNKECYIGTSDVTKDVVSDSSCVAKEEVNMWDEDEEWEPIETKSDSPQITADTNWNWEPSNTKLEPPKTKPVIHTKSWSWDWEPSDTKPDAEPVTQTKSWGWDLSSVLNAATIGVTTVTNQVSQGLSNVLETGIGAPDPTELARRNAEERATRGEEFDDKKSTTPLFGFGNLVSGVTQITKLVETTGNKVILGGLDTLETIGKKTMQVLQEGDPGLKKKRALLKMESEKPVLSHILREAKEKAELENRLLEEQHFARKANYESLFDDHQGLVHLEALEMLSKQCSIKLDRLTESQSGSELVELQETMNQIVELCELVDDEEELEDMGEIKEKLDSAVSEMTINISYDKLLATQNEAEQWLDNLNLQICSELELHEQAIATLAQLTALAVERYHKIGELLLIKEHRSTADEADSLVQITTILTMLIGNVATKFSNKLSEKLSTSTHKDHIHTLITNVYFESANSSTYLKNAFHLLIPVLQVGAI